MKKIQLMALDIDGCITQGEGCPIETDVMLKLRNISSAAAAGEPGVPALTLCTGRQHPYVDLMCQVLGITHTAVFENGAGVLTQQPYAFEFNEAVTMDMLDELARFKRCIQENLVAAGQAWLQPGKEASLSVYPTQGVTPQQNAEAMHALMHEHGFKFDLDVALPCVNVLIPGLNKGTGFRLVARKHGLELDEIGGVGDSPGDASYLGICGFAAVPVNAAPSLKEIAHYVSPHENGRGTVDIIEKCIARNLEIAE